MAKRRCKSKTKAGRRCRAAPLKGGETCSAHDRMRPDEDRFGSPIFSARAGASAKPHKPHPRDEMRRLAEEHARVIVAPYFRTLGLAVDVDDGRVTPCPRAVILAKHEGRVFASEVEDLAAQMAAARELLDRVYGRPRQSLEVAGAEDGPIALDVSGFDLSGLSDAELRLLQKGLERSDREGR
jgi:hypothetical protein